MFNVFFYCIFSFILNHMEINIHISIDEDTIIEPHALSESRKVLWVVLNVDLCLRVLKESSKSRFDSYSVRNSVLIISHITFRDCRVHIFSDILSRNSCILLHH